MPVKQGVIPERLRRSSAARRIGLSAAAIAGGLVALDLLGFVASVFFGAELLRAAEAAGVAEMLAR